MKLLPISSRGLYLYQSIDLCYSLLLNQIQGPILPMLKGNNHMKIPL
uniref:Uncharacterized protein n=1 Tax=Rhizophora mucronata TaxID=61149 RepID=A0A2P2NPD3_RHIMU